MSRRLLITGSRDWDDADAVCRALTEWLGRSDGLVVVHGGCPSGADAIAKRWVEGMSGAVEEAHPADWGRYGRAAGPQRNQEMIDLGADVCLAFPRGTSRGTRDCMRRAIAAGIPVVDLGEPA